MSRRAVAPVAVSTQLRRGSTHRMAQVPSDSEYLEQLIKRGRAFSFRSARTADPFDRAEQTSTHKWTEWFIEAEATVTRLAGQSSEASELIRKAGRLRSFGILPEDFYESRELAISAVLMCAAMLSRAAAAHQGTALTTPAYNRLWNRYGREIVIGIVVTVVGGIILALLL